MKPNPMMIIAIAIGAIALIYAGTVFLPDLFSADEIITDGTTIKGERVYIEDNPDSVTLTFNDKDKEDQDNDPTSVLRLYSPDAGNTSDDGTDTLAIKTIYSGLAGYDSTTYYAKPVQVDTSGAKGNQLLYEPELYRSGALTITVKNDDGSTVNSATNTQTIGANEEIEMTVRFDTTSNTYWGNPDALDLSRCSFQYNKTAILSVDVIEKDAIAKSSDFTFNASTTVFNGENTEIVPSVVDGTAIEFPIKIKSASLNPFGNILANCWDSNVDIREDNKQLIYGVEDEDQHVKSLRAVNFSISLA